MKKLLLGMTIALMTLTATLYAACTADVDMGNNKITNLAAPTAGNDATNKSYVDQKVLGQAYVITCSAPGNQTNVSIPAGLYKITNTPYQNIVALYTAKRLAVMGVSNQPNNRIVTDGNISDWQIGLNAVSEQMWSCTASNQRLGMKLRLFKIN
jgi:hypothetical protein